MTSSRRISCWCGAWWTGESHGHCSGCHRTFSSGAFDPHQTIKKGKVTCSVDKLVPHERPWGTLWRLPADERVQRFRQEKKRTRT